MSGQQPEHTITNGRIIVTVPQILDHEIIGVDLV
jgi:hypothetical protein